jgi:hypothetical protein
MRAKTGTVFCTTLLLATHITQASAQNRPKVPPASLTPTAECLKSTQKHVLFLMFLTSPPRIKDPDWVLQSTSAVEFDTCAACYSAALSITTSIISTPTINLVGWCLAKQGEKSGDAAIANVQPGEPVPLSKPLNLKMWK